MNKIIEESFRESIRSALSQLEVDLVSTLTKLIKYRYPKEVISLDFEIFSDCFTSQFPVYTYFLDKTNTEYFVYCDGKALYPSPVDPGLLDVESIYSEELEEQFVEANPDADPWDIATSEFMQWFLACWYQAGGALFPLTASIVPHDSSWELNLVSGEKQIRYHAFNP